MRYGRSGEVGLFCASEKDDLKDAPLTILWLFSVSQDGDALPGIQNDGVACLATWVPMNNVINMCTCRFHNPIVVSHLFVLRVVCASMVCQDLFRFGYR